MANTRYVKYSQHLLSNSLNSVDVVVSLVDGAVYTPNSADEFYDDIPGGAIVAESNPLASKTFTDGVFDAADLLIAAVPSGQDVDYLVLWIDTGTPSTSRLIGRIDTGTGLPLTPNGGDVNIVWSSGSAKIMRL